MVDQPDRVPDPQTPRTVRGSIVGGRVLNRRDILRLGVSLAGLAAVNALLAACGGDDDDDSPTATSVSGAATATSAPANTPEAAATATPAPQGQGSAILVNPGEAPDGVGGELRVALAFDATSLDPIATYTLNNGRWQENVFSGLVWRDTNLVVYDGKDGRPAPSEGFGLAESWEYTDDLTLVFKLRPGITFHNGEPFNAETVRAHFQRMHDPATASPQAFNYTSIKEVIATDDLTATMIFNEVDPVMISKLAGYGGFMTPAEASKDTTKFGPVEAAGTGPYRITEYVKDDHITLEAWDGYWGPRKPHIQKIIYRIIPDDNTRLSEFLAGSIDVLTLSPVQADAAKGAAGVQVVPIGVPTVSGLRLDASKPPTDNKLVRQAIAHAIDMPTIIETILSGYAKEVGIWQSEFSFGYEDIAPYAYDPEAAKAKLAEAGVATPVAVTFDVIGGDTVAREMANAMKDMLDAVGFNVTLNQKDAANYYNEYIAGDGGNIVPFGWGGWTLDYDNTYFSMMHTGQTYNPSYSNPEVDALLDEQRGTLDQAKRLEIAKQLNALLFEDAIDVCLYQNIYLWGVNNRVRNFSIPPDERLFWLDAWIQS